MKYREKTPPNKKAKQSSSDLYDDIKQFAISLASQEKEREKKGTIIYLNK